MHTALTNTQAKDLGRKLKFLRLGRNETLADVAGRSGISVGYLQNLESGVRANADEESWLRLARGLRIDEDVIADLVFRARVMTALECRKIDPEAAEFVWRGVEQRLAEQGTHLHTDLSAVISDLLRNSNGR